jgi:hypothetical protein
MALDQRLRALLLLALAATVLAVPASALAEVHIARGQSVDELHVLGDDVRVDGVLRNVLVVGGNVIVGPTGRLEGGVLISGRLRIEPGGRLSGDFTEIGGTWPHPGGWPLVLGLIGLLIFRSLAIWWLVRIAVVLAPFHLMSSLLGVTRARPLRSLLVGALAGFGLAAGTLVLAHSVLGLAVALALAGVLIVGTVVGVSMTLAALGIDAERRRLVLVALLLPVVGDALLALASVAGLGALLRYAADVEPAAPRVRSVD